MRGGNPRFQGKVVYSILISVILFGACQFGLLTRDMSILDEKKDELEAEIATKERKLGDLQRNKWTKERDVFRLERRVKELENRLRGRRDLINKDKAAGINVNGETIIYLITPTYNRPTMRADLTRLSHTLMHVPNLVWLIVEDASAANNTVIDQIIRRSGLKCVHLSARTPGEFKMNPNKDPNWLKPRGVAQRNAGLRWLRKNMMSDGSANGVVYFADDDNTYDLRLFDQIRSVQKVGVWPVGLVGGLMVERAVVDNQNPDENGQLHIKGWIVGWKPERPFPIDMAAFAVNLRLLKDNPDAEFSYDVERGYQESHLLTSLGVTLEDLEPKASGCTQVYVWHTRTEKPKLKTEHKLFQNKGIHSDDGIVV